MMFIQSCRARRANAKACAAFLPPPADPDRLLLAINLFLIVVGCIALLLFVGIGTSDACALPAGRDRSAVTSTRAWTTQSDWC